MRRKLWLGMFVVGFIGVGLGTMLRVSAAAQKPRDESTWEYKVGILSYNPGDRLTDERRAAVYERTLSDQARQGWEPVGSLLSRDTIQTVGGGVTTRETTSFVAYRRKR